MATDAFTAPPTTGTLPRLVAESVVKSHSPPKSYPSEFAGTTHTSAVDRGRPLTLTLSDSPARPTAGVTVTW